MGYKRISINVPPGYDDDMLRDMIARRLGIRSFTFQMERKSLDARKKNDIHWNLGIGVLSDELEGGDVPRVEALEIPFVKTRKHILVVGSGPAGFFCAYVLQKAGFRTTIVERGSDADKRRHAVKEFEKTGKFDRSNNYAFGEGGAGTFSDGKLTSRSRRIGRERRFIIDTYIRAGAPPEIAYSAHPHLGTDNLVKIVKILRRVYTESGGSILFDTMLEDLVLKDGRVTEAVTSAGLMAADGFIFAPGHSAYETYRMLMRRGVAFKTKKFAIGSRMEHLQEIINEAQWGRTSLEGVKSAEYRLTSRGDGKHDVYTFCMCPGGRVVPATAYAGANITNGMSYYARDGSFGNAACVVGLHPGESAGREVSPEEALDMVEDLERGFYRYTGGYAAPGCSIQDFIEGKLRTLGLQSTYPLGLVSAPLWELLPGILVDSMRAGLKDFIRRMRGFETGNLLGLESKTSAPIQAIREKGGLCRGFENLYLVGEGSGLAGGIVSSAADGVRVAMHMILGSRS